LASVFKGAIILSLSRKEDV